MRYLLSLALAVLASIGNVYGADRQVSVVGGSEVSDNSFPWMVSYITADADGFYRCGGTVIGSRWILTAAHCVEGRFVVTVGYGSNDLDEQFQVAASQVIVHPAFQSSPKRVNDIALIETTAPMGITPVSLPMDGNNMPLTGELATVAGWGITESGSSVSRLKSAEIEIQSENSCFIYTAMRELGGDFTFPANSIVCAVAVPNTPHQGGCNGDSGGPLAVERGERLVQVGIVSGGSLNCDPGISQEFARVEEYLGWIQTYVDDVNTYSSVVPVDHLPESYTSLPVNSSVSGTVDVGQSRVFRVSNAATATLTSNVGDADLLVFSGSKFSINNLICFPSQAVQSCALSNQNNVYLLVYGFDSASFTLEVTDQNGVTAGTVSPTRLIQDSPVAANISAGESITYTVPNGLTLSLITEFGDTEMRVFDSPDFSVLSLNCTDQQFCNAATNTGVSYVQVYGRDNSRFVLTASTTVVQTTAVQTDSLRSGGNSGGGAFWTGFIVLLILRRFSRKPGI